MTWNERFLVLFDRCVERYRKGDKDFTGYYDDAGDAALLAEIGYKPREFFDFVEDFCEEGEPSPSTALLIAAVRRDYFKVVMKEQAGEKELTRDDIPTFGDELEGVPYFPRILAKARAKLSIRLADVPTAPVWAAEGDDAKILSWIRAMR